MGICKGGVKIWPPKVQVPLTSILGLHDHTPRTRMIVARIMVHTLSRGTHAALCAPAAPS